MTRYITPQDLADAGYRIEVGDEEVADVAPELVGKYWWTWSVGSGLDVSFNEWDTADGAIADAYRDMKEQD